MNLFPGVLMLVLVLVTSQHYSVALNSTATTTKVPITTTKTATTTQPPPPTTTKTATATPAPSTSTKTATTTPPPPPTTKTATTTPPPLTTSKTATVTPAPSTTAKSSSTTASLVKSLCGVANSSKTCEYPWMVMIYDNLHQTVCSGSIIDERHILTAAHCFVHRDPTTGAISYSSVYDLTVYTGSNVMPFDVSIPGVVSRKVVTIATHQNFDPKTFSAVVARDTDGRFARALGSLSGTYESTIKWADVPVVSDVTCQTTYGTYYTGSNFCAGSSVNNSCRGDSGGPLACKEADGRFYQYGIVVAGDCGYAGLYTKVSNFLPWIDQMKILMTTVA